MSAVCRQMVKFHVYGRHPVGDSQRSVYHSYDGGGGRGTEREREIDR